MEMWGVSLMASFDLTQWHEWATQLDQLKQDYHVQSIEESPDQLFEQRVKGTIRPGFTVMDLGCGNGELTLTMAEWCNKVIGVDVSRRTLDQARQKQAERGINNVQFVHSSGTDLLFSANSIDVMVSRMGPLGFSNFLDEAKRVVKRDGILMEMTVGDDDFNEIRSYFVSPTDQQMRIGTKTERLMQRLESHRYTIEWMEDLKQQVVFPTIVDLIGALAASQLLTEIIPERDIPRFRTIWEKLATPQGIPLTVHRVIWVATNQK
jgi:ubiquinone/menaquinone biosynthesis C-methylase UbiE